MRTKDRLEELIRDMPEDLKVGIYDFACFLLMKRYREDIREWSLFSLRQALQGLEQEEELYTEADLKIRWQ
jgi:hypothetical protein